MDWRTDDEISPRFLILDECETLTEAAQLSLQTILNCDPKNICVILICNSQSRIHPKLRQRLLKIRYDPPNRNEKVCDIFTAITRGDLRQISKKLETETRIWKYVHCHSDEIKSIIHDTTVDYQTIISDILLLSDMFGILDATIINRINLLYPLIADATILHDEVEIQIIKLIYEFKQKFETRFWRT